MRKKRKPRNHGEIWLGSFLDVSGKERKNSATELRKEEQRGETRERKSPPKNTPRPRAVKFRGRGKKGKMKNLSLAWHEGGPVKKTTKGDRRTSGLCLAGRWGSTRESPKSRKSFREEGACARATEKKAEKGKGARGHHHHALVS